VAWFRPDNIQRSSELPGKDLVRPSWRALAAQGFKGAWEAARKVRQTPNTFRFLIAYILYNDGRADRDQHGHHLWQGGDRLSEGVLVLTLLGIQAVALGGAMAFSWLARRFGAKQALMLSLVGWIAIAVYGRTITSAGEYFGLGVAVGLVLGGSQALSRSVYSQLVPRDEPAVYFGFSRSHQAFGRARPLLFAVVRQSTGSARPAILALVCFFVAGLVLLTRVRLENNDA